MRAKKKFDNAMVLHIMDYTQGSESVFKTELVIQCNRMCNLCRTDRLE